MNNQKKFGLVMPCYTPSEKVLGRAIKSLLEQFDYENWKLIVVFDGENKDGEEVMKGFNDPRITSMTIPHAGACAARNAGAEILLKDTDVAYLSFFSSDFVAYPGMFRIWAKELDEHPECGFVYGGYDVLDPVTGKTVGALNGEPFDYRQLQTANYIDGGFPLRREVYLPWDINCKSLNDWDFWLNICDKSVKGYFMNNRTYAADAPKAGGLSNDSSTNWLERVGYIKTKHNIPQRDVVVCSVGAPFHAKRVADMIGADFSHYPSFKPHKYKMVYLLGLYVTSIDYALNMAFNNCGDDVVKAVHWIGNDVYLLGNLPLLDLKRMRYGITEKMEYNICEYPYTKMCLEAAGIRSGIGGDIPLLGMPMERPKEVYPMPKDFTIAVYNPATPLANDKYYINFMQELAFALPDVKFLFYGGLVGETKNIKAISWCPMDEVIKQSSLLLRFTQFDGLPNSAIEFLMHNRQVITNTPMPYVEYFDTLAAGSMNRTNEYNRPMMKERLINRIRMLKRDSSITYPWDKIKDFYMSFCGVDYVKSQIAKMVRKEVLDKVVFPTTFYKAGIEKTDLLDKVRP